MKLLGETLVTVNNLVKNAELELINPKKHKSKGKVRLVEFELV